MAENEVIASTDIKNAHVANMVFSIVYGTVYGIIGIIYGVSAMTNDSSDPSEDPMFPSYIFLTLAFLCMIAYVVSYATYTKDPPINKIVYIPFAGYVITTMILLTILLAALAKH